MNLITRIVPALVLASSVAQAGITTVTSTGGFDDSFAPVSEQGVAGVVALHTDGTIMNHLFNQPNGQPENHLLRNQGYSHGVTAVSDGDPRTAPVYVFSAEADGLWYTSITNLGTTHSAWCHADTNYNIWSAPSAVYIGRGSIRIYAQSKTDHLLQWRITPAASGCTHATADDRADILVSTPPVATSWSQVGWGRVDVFATYVDHVVHGYKLETDDDWGVDTLKWETTFTVDGANRQIQIEPWTTISATAPASNTLDALFRAPNGDIRHLSYRANVGFKTEFGLAAWATDYEIDTTTDMYVGSTFISHGCVDASSGGAPQCGSGGIDAAGFPVSHSSATFFVNNVLAMHGITIANRFLFVVDAMTNQLVYSKGDTYSGY